MLLVVPRGEAVRNFLYSDALQVLAERAKVTLLSVVSDEALLGAARRYLDDVIPLHEHRPPLWSARLRTLAENAHDRWLWSEVAKNNWELRDRRAREQGAVAQRAMAKLAARACAFRPVLRALTRAEQALSLRSAAASEQRALLMRLQPTLVFNGSHIHGMAGELPLKVASSLGIPTAGFIFSWDNLTSRSRIFVPYDWLLVWHESMKRQFLRLYPEVGPQRVIPTGTPQFDFHFRAELLLSREELCRRLGIDARRPFVLYTTGISNHFYHEHRHVATVARLLSELGIDPLPQLVVRTYVKGTSDEMRRLAERGLPDTVFPPVLWEPRWQTPTVEDQVLYTSLLRHCALGVNAASTVSLELMIFGKPIINLGFDPPGSDLPWCMGYERHIRFDHYRPVAESGAVMVARTNEDLASMLRRGLTRPSEGSELRREFISSFFDGRLDGLAGKRVGALLAELAGCAGGRRARGAT